MSAALRARLVTGGILALVFGSGVLAGVAGDRLLGGDPVELLAGPSPRSTELPVDVAGGSEDEATDPDAPERRRSALIHRVDLSEGQRVSVDSVLSYYRAHVRSLTDTYDAAYWEAVQRTREELRAILNEEQRVRYDALLAENDRRRGRTDESR